MMLRRCIVALVVVQVVIVAYMGEGMIRDRTDLPIIPVLCGILAVASLKKAFRIPVNTRRKRLLLEVLALFFLLKWKVINPQLGLLLKMAPFTDYLFLFNLAQYLLVFQALELFLHVRDAKQPNRAPFFLVPLCAVGVVACVSDYSLTSAMQQGEKVRQGSIFLTALFTTVFAITMIAMQQRHLHKSGWLRYVFCALLLIVALLAGTTSSLALHENQWKVDHTFAQLMGYRFAGLSASGFSRQANLNSLISAKHANMKRVALRVVGKDQPGYFRALAFESYNGTQWRLPASRKSLLGKKMAPAVLPNQEPNDYFFTLVEPKEKPLRVLDVWPDPTMKDLLFMPQRTSCLAAPVDAIQVDENRSVLAPTITPGASYRLAVGEENQPESISEDMKRRYTTIPEDLDPRIRTLAQSVLQGKPTTPAKLAAVQSYFTSNYEYLLGATFPPEVDPLTYFLLDQPPAHCEFFAAGAAILLRLGGIPARYVTGFVVAEEHPFGGYWLARSRDAHAWVEAWDEDRGWVIVEATPASGLPMQDAEGRAGYLWDYVKLQAQRLKTLLQQGVKRILLTLVRTLRHALLDTIAGRVLLCAFAALMFYRWITGISRRPRRQVSPEIQEFRRLLRQMDHQVKKRGVVRRDNETIRQFAQRLVENGAEEPWRNAASEWYLAYSRFRYRQRDLKDGHEPSHWPKPLPSLSQ